jgi:hypothetical protein
MQCTVLGDCLPALGILEQKLEPSMASTELVDSSVPVHSIKVLLVFRNVQLTPASLLLKQVFY